MYLMKKKYLLILILIFITKLSTLTFAKKGDYSFKTSLTQTGNRTGALRYEFGGNWYTNLGFTIQKDEVTSERKTDGLIELFYKNFGLMMSSNVSEDPQLSYALKYAVDRPLTQRISLGISVNLVDFPYNDTKQVMTGWDAYLVINIGTVLIQFIENNDTTKELYKKELIPLNN